MTNIEKFGFSLIRRREIDEIYATLYEFSHDKTGARIIYLDREDDNKTFAIGFATPPEDDTGVFHIIEHSVLCGSEKYPLNDPFAELLKGSLNTFLNAMTYEDRTIYPFSSRCEKDFLNLADIYLDAVFSPNLIKNPAIFRQEGWHYEYDEENDRLSYNGVVYNEMKGVYSSPDELSAQALNRALFSDTAYCYESGGRPDAIPDLTYEMFKEAHQKYYHPSKAKIFLDGKIDLEKLLPVIDSHLSKFDKTEPISLAGKSKPRVAPTVEIKYEIPESEDAKGRARVLYGYVYSDYSDDVAQLTVSVLSDILCGSNASPLKKALLEKGLCKDASMYSVRSREHTLVIEVRDADEERLDEIDTLIEEVLINLVSDGIEKGKIISTLNSIEFRLRERDYGALPTGIVFAMNIYGSWMYCDTPENTLLLNSAIAEVRDRIAGDYLEKTIENAILNNPHRARIIMLADKSLGERNAKEEAERLSSILEKMSKDDIERIKSEEKELRLWQQTEPTAEQLSCLPMLTLADIPEKSVRPFATESEYNSVKIISCPVKTNGIVYISLLFDASDLAGEELIKLSTLSAALLNFPTESYDALSLQNEIKANLGSLFASFVIGNRNGACRPYLKIGAKALESKTEDITRLVGELLLKSRIDDPAEMSKILLQAKSNLEDMIISSGESVALARAQASMSESGAISEYLSGYEAYRILNLLTKSEEKIAALTTEVSKLLEQLITKKRLTLSVAGQINESFIRDIISLFPDGDCAPEKKITHTCASKSEYFLLPSKVAYAVMSGKSDRIKENLGAMRVARSILSYEYLWNTVRVQSGAYGTGFIPKKEGEISFYSYRDPAPVRSLGFYKSSSDYLRSLARENTDITKFIIGSIGEYDTLITPRTATTITTSDYLNGWHEEDEIRVRTDMLNMTAEDLLAVADIIDEALDDKRVIIVGGQEQLDSLEEKPENIITI